MSDEVKFPPLPEKAYLGDDVSYGYEPEDMLDFAREAVALNAPPEAPAVEAVATVDADGFLVVLKGDYIPTGAPLFLHPRLSDETILSAWRAWPRTGITSAAKALEFVRYVEDQAATDLPIDVVLHCPSCGLQHIDEPERSLGPNNTERLDWDNPPHRSHLCHGCGHIWRPADVPTNGVLAVKTKGKADSPAPTPEVKPEAALSDERLHDIIGEHLIAAYACTRVWEAWSVGTMTEDDFTPLAETEFADELARAIQAALAAKPKTGEAT